MDGMNVSAAVAVEGQIGVKFYNQDTRPHNQTKIKNVNCMPTSTKSLFCVRVYGCMCTWARLTVNYISKQELNDKEPQRMLCKFEHIYLHHSAVSFSAAILFIASECRIINGTCEQTKITAQSVFELSRFTQNAHTLKKWLISIIKDGKEPEKPTKTWQILCLP